MNELIMWVLVWIIFWVCIGAICSQSIAEHPGNFNNSGHGVGIVVAIFGVFGLIYYFVEKNRFDSVIASQQLEEHRKAAKDAEMARREEESKRICAENAQRIRDEEDRKYKRLREIADLHKDGILTDEEYNAEKAKIIGR